MQKHIRTACIISIPGYVFYSDGRIYSEKTNKFLRQTKSKSNGYCFLELSTPNGPKNLLVHRLIATAFLPNINELPQVNHKNEIRHDNRAENLEWCTAKYNMNYGNRQAKIRRNRHVSKDNLAKFRAAGTRAVMRPVINLDTGEIFECAAYASAHYGSRGGSHISEVCKGRRKTALKYRWAYYERSDDLSLSQY